MTAIARKGSGVSPTLVMTEGITLIFSCLFLVFFPLVVVWPAETIGCERYCVRAGVPPAGEKKMYVP